MSYLFSIYILSKITSCGVFQSSSGVSLKKFQNKNILSLDMKRVFSGFLLLSLLERASYVKHTTSWIKLITYIWLLHVEYYAQHMANSVVMNIFFFNFQVCGISLLKYTLRPNAHDKLQQDDIFPCLNLMVLSIGLTTNILMHAYYVSCWAIIFPWPIDRYYRNFVPNLGQSYSYPNP